MVLTTGPSSTKMTLLLLLFVSPAICSEWSYEKPINWDDHGQCGTGKRQSPIDITGYHFNRGNAFQMLHYDKASDMMTIQNNGHSVKLSIEGTMPEVKGGELKGTFRFAQLHLHWGNESTVGSEHLLNGRAFPLEVHWVHYNTKYQNIGEAISHKDGLAVLGVFYQLSQQENTHLKPVIDDLANAKAPGSKSKLTQSFPLDSLLPHDRSVFYRYNGSLTTPGCNEVVTWTVFHETLPISESQLAKLRMLSDGHGYGLGNNYRPVQPINGRRVTAIVTSLDAALGLLNTADKGGDGPAMTPCPVAAGSSLLAGFGIILAALTLTI